MATREQIESMKIDENIFELVEDTELEYLVHFAAPFTGGDKCLVPKGTDNNDDLLEKMREQVKTNYENLFTRLQGFSFFITEKQLQTLPLKFRSGSAERLIEIMCKLRSPLYPMFP